MSMTAKARTTLRKFRDAWSPEARAAAAEARQMHTGMAAKHTTAANVNRDQGRNGVAVQHDLAAKYHTMAATHYGNKNPDKGPPCAGRKVFF